MIVESLLEYDKDLKKLVRKYHTLNSDLEDVIKVLRIRPNAQPPFSYRMSGLGVVHEIIKVKKIASDSFKGRGNNSGFRLIYAYLKDLPCIVLIELYHKNDKEKEDRTRIISNFI